MWTTCNVYFVNIAVLRGVKDFIPMSWSSLLMVLSLTFFPVDLISIINSFRVVVGSFLNFRQVSTIPKNNLHRSTWPWQVDGCAIFLRLMNNWTNIGVRYIYMCKNLYAWRSFRITFNCLLPKMFRYLFHYTGR